MRQHQCSLRVETNAYGITNISREVQCIVAESGIDQGLCTVFVRHTSASLLIQENADPSVLADLKSFMDELVPQSRKYRHADEGPDDMPAHIRSALTRTAETIPVTQGRLVLGTWQGLYLWEHRGRENRRELVVHVIGE